jgi:signal transduction histidine kinase
MKRTWKAVLSGTLMTAACLAALFLSNRRERNLLEGELERDTRLVARQFADRTRGALERHVIALQQLVATLEHQSVNSRESFDSLSSKTETQTSCRRLAAIDRSGRVRWVHRPVAAGAADARALDSNSREDEAIAGALRTGAPALSRPLRLGDGPPGFILTVPARPGAPGIAAVTCFVSGEDFFGSLALSGMLERYDVTVADAGGTLFAGASEPEASDAIPTATEAFHLGSRTWTLRVTMLETIYRTRLHSREAAVWTLGTLVALVLGAAGAAAVIWTSDVSRRLQAQEEIRKTDRQLHQAEKMTALGGLVAGVAHEVNNPLASIIGYTQLVLRRDLPPEVRRRLEIVSSEAERAGQIVKNLLTFARKHPPEKRYLGLNGIVEKTLELKAYHFKTNQIRVEKDFQPDLPKTMLDFYQIQEVLLNLFNNAEQALSESGRGGLIRITTRAEAGRIEARISDDGPGIPSEIQQRIFEPFFTTKKEGKGTGLGLSLSHGIMQAMGGSIRVESSRGDGATFIIDLPILPEPTAAVVVAPAAPRYEGPPLRILVIDDEPNVQGALVDLLTSGGHRVDTASDTPEAFRKIASNGHDLIITDMKMPHGTGQDVYRAVVEKSSHLARRIIFMTGDGANEDILKFIAEVGSEIVVKPFRLEDIEQALARVAKH